MQNKRGNKGTVSNNEHFVCLQQKNVIEGQPYFKGREKEAITIRSAT